MNREQFMAALREKLAGLPEEDIVSSLEYYGEMIDDRIEDGVPEETAVAAVGSVDEIAEQILMDTPLTKLVQARVKSKRSLKAWEIVLLVLGSPIWLSLLIAAAAVVLSVYITLWAIIISLFAVVLRRGGRARGDLPRVFWRLAIHRAGHRRGARARGTGDPAVFRRGGAGKAAREARRGDRAGHQALLCRKEGGQEQ